MADASAQCRVLVTGWPGDITTMLASAPTASNGKLTPLNLLVYGPFAGVGPWMPY